MPRKTKRYGWIPDLPDKRDHRFTLYTLSLMAPLPPSVDLRAGCPPVYDQGDLGSCTANAIAGALEFDAMKQGLGTVAPSRLFIYYNERVIEGTVDYDSGAQIRDGIKSVNSQGDCPETEWPYDESQFAVQPPPPCYTDAMKQRAVSYESVPQTVTTLRSCLAAGYPFVFGFTVYESFESGQVAQTGVVPMPGPDESVVGGHAVLAVGYDDAANTFLVRNSWGPGWGMAGYFTMPYSYITDANLASDFWTIQTVGS